MKQDNLEELLPCPFCGSNARLRIEYPYLPTGRQDILYYVECTLKECGIETMKWYPKMAAIQAWNRRVKV